MVCRVKRIIFAAAWIGVICIAPVAGQSGAQNGEWRTYGGDLGNTRYAPLDQINAANFNQLEIAWRFKTDNLGPRPEYKFESTPLMVEGRRCTRLPARGAPSSRSTPAPASCCGCTARTKASAARPRRGSCRAAGSRTGPTGGRADPLRHARLPLDRARRARPACRSPAFGDNGVVDLKLDDDQEMDLVTGEIGLHATPVVAKNVVIVGAAHRPAATRRATQREGIRARLRRADRQAAVDFPHDSAARRVRTTPGRKNLRLHRQHRRLGADLASTKNSGSRICRSKCRPANTTAAIGRATACLARASSRSI